VEHVRLVLRYLLKHSSTELQTSLCQWAQFEQTTGVFIRDVVADDLNSTALNILQCFRLSSCETGMPGWASIL